MTIRRTSSLADTLPAAQSRSATAGRVPIPAPGSRRNLPVETSPGESRGAFPGEITLTLPWPPAVVHQNGRINRFRKASATKAYRKACADAAWNAGANPMDLMTLVSVTFCPPDRRRRDDDGMIGAFKAGRDGIADALGVDDNGFRPSYHVAEPTPGGAIIARLVPIPIPG